MCAWVLVARRAVSRNHGYQAHHRDYLIPRPTSHAEVEPARVALGVRPAFAVSVIDATEYDISNTMCFIFTVYFEVFTAIYTLMQRPRYALPCFSPVYCSVY